jgi:predicted RNase H-like HicB family nuclease
MLIKGSTREELRKNAEEALNDALLNLKEGEYLNGKFEYEFITEESITQVEYKGLANS